MAAPPRLHLSRPQERMLAALEDHRFFKLICGGSFTESHTVGLLAHIYSHAGADCIDIAPDPVVVNRVLAVLDELPPEVERPALMVSLALDEDPHFRKAELVEPACIQCNECIPVCPTEAIFIPERVGGKGSGFPLAIEDPLCYGCGRCVDVCPTDALTYHRLNGVSEPIQDILSHPAVDAVEIHTTALDLASLETFLTHVAPLMDGKIVALCYRPRRELSADLEATFLTRFREGLERIPGVAFPRVFLQIDGRPMSGSGHPDASRPSIAAAKWVHQRYGQDWPLITISGGINQYTAGYLKEADASFIAGAGVGTVARQWVWQWVHPPGSPRENPGGMDRDFPLVASGFGPSALGPSLHDSQQFIPPSNKAVRAAQQLVQPFQERAVSPQCHPQTV